MSSESDELLPRGRSASSDVLPAGALIDRFVVNGIHARAGFSDVYRATDTATGQSVALKLLHEELARSTKSIARFRREYEALVSIRHPNVVDILDYGELASGRPYFVMEWCEGATLKTFLGAGGFMIEEALPILEQVVAALEAVHAKGVVHRDLKSSNIMLAPSAAGAPTVKLIDFGIVKANADSEAVRSDLTTTGACLGTPHVMAPEQVLSMPLDARTDVYALGVLIFEMLTGQRPFLGASAAETLDMHLNFPPPRVSDLAPAPPAVDEVVQRCMAKRAHDRYGRPLGALRALEAATRPPDGGGGWAQAGPADAIAVHFEAGFLCPEEKIDDEDFDLLDASLSTARYACERIGFRVVLESGSGFLAVSLLPSEPDEERRVRRRLLAVSLQLAREIEGAAEGRPFEARLVFHRGAVVVTPAGGTTELQGGALLSLSDWSVEAGAGVVATRAAVRGLEEELELEPLGDRPGYVWVRAAR